MDDQQFISEKFLQTYQENTEQEMLKFKFLVGRLEELSVRIVQKEAGEGSSKAEHHQRLGVWVRQKNKATQRRNLWVCRHPCMHPEMQK